MYPESRTRRQLIDAWLPDAFLNPHGYPSHEWVQPFSEYTGWVQSRAGRQYRPRLVDSARLVHQHGLSARRAASRTARRWPTPFEDRIVEAERGVPGLLPLEDRMNARYERFGQRWQPSDMFQPIVNGIRIYMSLERIAAGGGRGGAAARSRARRGGRRRRSPRQRRRERDCRPTSPGTPLTPKRPMRPPTAIT